MQVAALDRPIMRLTRSAKDPADPKRIRMAWGRRAPQAFAKRLHLTSLQGSDRVAIASRHPHES